MAIVSVLWSVALLSIIAVSLMSTGTMSSRLARHALEVAARDAMLEAVINRAVVGILDPRADKRWRADGVAQAFAFEGAHASVSVQDELGRIDLNQADGPAFLSLLQSVGTDADAASRLVDKILDWRDRSQAKRLNGAKDQDYQLAGRNYRTRNGPFQSVDELRLVLDMTPDLFRRIEPALTVYSGRPMVDPKLAPRAVLLTLPGMDAAKVEALIASRQPDDIFDPVNTLKGHAFMIRARVETGNAGASYDAAIRLTGHRPQPYWLLSWKGS